MKDKKVILIRIWRDWIEPYYLYEIIYHDGTSKYGKAVKDEIKKWSREYNVPVEGEF